MPQGEFAYSAKAVDPEFHYGVLLSVESEKGCKEKVVPIDA